MPVAAMLSICLTVLLLLLSFVFKIAGKLSLTLPLVYILLMATVLNKWASAHEPLAIALFFGLLFFTLLRWILALKDRIQEWQYLKTRKEDVQWQIQRAHEMGIPMEDIYIDASGDMRYNSTHESVF